MDELGMALAIVMLYLIALLVVARLIEGTRLERLIKRIWDWMYDGVEKAGNWIDRKTRRK